MSEDFDPTPFQDKSQRLFIRDMLKAGYALRTYSGRSMYGKECPAVYCERDRFTDIVRATKAPIRHDTLGKGYIVYVV